MNPSSNRFTKLKLNEIKGFEVLIVSRNDYDSTSKQYVGNKKSPSEEGHNWSYKDSLGATAIYGYARGYYSYI